ESHPFTISSAPAEDVLRLTIKASGDFTRALHQTLKAGDGAIVMGAYGMFDYKTGRPDQIWIAGGIGLTPFLAFIRDGGYDRPELWLSDGWAHLAALGPERWRGPLYWREDGDEVLEYTLAGEAPLDLQAPVCHVSGFEADAYARWCNARLPTEAEWETAAACAPMTGNFVDAGVFHPAVSAADSLYGNVWEWTASSYGPYPGFKPFAGQLGEYNGKFMANQLVLRGGSCATPQSHIRPTYRNFFYPPDRWQFSGIRLARDVG
ncbi:MAG: SUMF1/EgtB/PvdO family nonheme iron enzyme, partial [Pseudohongiellaceae bacterium]